MFSWVLGLFFIHPCERVCDAARVALASGEDLSAWTRVVSAQSDGRVLNGQRASSLVCLQ